MSTRVFHKVIGGDPDTAVKYGLTLKAKCGEVWVPTIVSNAEEHPEIPHCTDCYPTSPTFVYRLYDAESALIYIGCTRDPRTREGAHRKNSWWWPQVEHVRLTIFPSRAYALQREAQAIASERPLWNVRHQEFAGISLDGFQQWHDRAENLEAPSAFKRRLRREALRQYGVNIEVAS